MRQPERRARLGAGLAGVAWLVTLLVGAGLPLVQSASAQSAVSCPKGLKTRAVAEMIFGRNIGEIEAAVGEEDWQRFLDEMVTPRFPDGLTVLEASGQWWNPPEGRIEREPAKILLIVLADERGQVPKLAEIASAYKRRFSQQTVIVMIRRACVTF